MSSAFDRALETQRRIDATEDYALRHGRPDSSAYRAAWLQARQRDRLPVTPGPSQGEPPALGDAVAVVGARSNAQR